MVQNDILFVWHKYPLYAESKLSQTAKTFQKFYNVQLKILFGYFFLHFNFLPTENSSNIRRDITAETSLMNDLDKRLNSESESPADCRFNYPNVNLLISLQSDENLSGNNSQWCFHDTSKTNSDNASLERYGNFIYSQF